MKTRFIVLCMILALVIGYIIHGDNPAYVLPYVLVLYVIIEIIIPGFKKDKDN